MITIPSADALFDEITVLRASYPKLAQDAKPAERLAHWEYVKESCLREKALWDALGEVVMDDPSRPRWAVAALSAAAMEALERSFRAEDTAQRYRQEEQ